MSRKARAEHQNTFVEDTLPQKEIIQEPSQPELAPASQNQSLPMVKLRIFVASSGNKPDQMAGFEAFAKALKLGPMTIPQWREEMDKFLKRPMK